MRGSNALLKIIGYGVSIVLSSLLLIYWIIGSFSDSALRGIVVLLLVALMVGIGIRSGKDKKEGEQ